MVTCHSSFPAPDAFQTAELRSMRAGPQRRQRDGNEGDDDDEGDDDGDDGDEGGDDDGGGGGDDNDDDTNDDDSTPSLSLAASDRPPQPSVQLGDISSFDLVDGENLFFLLEKRTGNSSSKQHPPVTLLLDT